jgi:hypothetical protein
MKKQKSRREPWREQAGITGQRTALGARAVGSARADVEQLLAAFLADPRGDAGQMTRTLLFNTMVKERTQQEQQTLCELMEHERRTAVLEEDVGSIAVDRLNADTRNTELVQALHRARAQGRKIRQHVGEQQKALAEEKPFNYDRALKQISAVIGVGQPLEEIREPKRVVKSEVEGTPDYHLTWEEYTDFCQGRGPAWEEEQRRKREQDQKRSLE